MGLGFPSEDSKNKRVMKPEYQILQQAIQTLAGTCDGARTWDDKGFSKYDADFGHSLARQNEWSDKQAKAAQKLVIKYSRQLPSELVETARHLTFDIPVETVAELPAIESLLQWSEAKEVRGGELSLRTAPPTQQFWAHWKFHKRILQDSGIAPKQINGQWIINWWRKNPKLEKGEVEKVEVAAECEPVIIPCHLIDKLLPHQPAIAGKLVSSISRFQCALDASQTGVGKTYSALAAAILLNKEPVVICPKSIIPGWKSVAKHFGINIQVINYEGVKTGKTGLGHWIEVEYQGKKYEVFQWTLKENNILIFDEAARLKGLTTDNSKLLIAAKKDGIPILLLSATAASSPLDMRAIGFALGLFSPLRSFYDWAKDNGVFKGRFGLEFNNQKSELEKIHKSIFGTGRGVRVKTSEIPGFPESLNIAEEIDFNGAGNDIQAIYDEMNAEIEKLRARMDQDTSLSILTEILRARQKVELLKIPTISSLVNDSLDEGNSVVVYLNFNDSIDALAKRLKTNCIIRGGQSEKERQGFIDSFQADKERVVICNLQIAEGFGLHDLNGNYSRVTYLSPSFNPRHIIQAFGRTPRAEGKSKCIQKILFATGTIEVRACQALRQKINNIDLINDNDLSMGITF